jgi:hypothetical protein
MTRRSTQARLSARGVADTSTKLTDDGAVAADQLLADVGVTCGSAIGLVSVLPVAKADPRMRPLKRASRHLLCLILRRIPARSGRSATTPA